MSRSLWAVVAVAVLGACGGESAAFERIASFPGLAIGDVVGVRDAGDAVEYLSRRTGEIRSVTIDGSDDRLVATIDIGADGEQRGLLGWTMIGDRGFAAWTEPETLDLVVGEIRDGGVDRIVWNGTGTASKAVGGRLETHGGQLLLGVGSLTDFGRAAGSGALVLLDPDGEADQEPDVLAAGWNNPWAFTVADDGTIWVADNAPDGSDRPVAERDGELIVDAGRTRASFLDPPPQRAHSAIVELPDGRLGVCGFLDDEMLAYEIPDADDDEPDELRRAGTIGRCQTGAVTLDDGSVIVVTSDDDVPVMLRLPPSD